MAIDPQRGRPDDTDELHEGFVSILDHIAQFEREQADREAQDPQKEELMSDLVGHDHPLYSVFKLKFLA